MTSGKQTCLYSVTDIFYTTATLGSTAYVVFMASVLAVLLLEQYLQYTFMHFSKRVEAHRSTLWIKS